MHIDSYYKANYEFLLNFSHIRLCYNESTLGRSGFVPLKKEDANCVLLLLFHRD